MPRFEVIPISEARLNSTTGKRAAILREYIGYVQSVPEGEAGSLHLGPGETTNAIRRRIGAAAEALGKHLTVKRTENVIYFWVEQGNGRRRRGRPRAS